MSRKSILPFAGAAILTLVVACSKDKASTTEPTGDTLTAAEANSLSDVLSQLVGFFNPNMGASPATAAGLAAQQGGNFNYNQTANCTNGGTVQVTGSYSYTSTASGGNFSGSVTQTPSSCKLTSEDGRMFTLNGNPSLTMALTMSMNSTTGAYNGTFHETGGLNWGTGGRAGGCTIDINITYNVTAAGVASGSASGTVCGQSVNESF
jgi:hypothetical protein